MALRTWAKVVGTAFGVAALAGASQLGLAYGLGILRLSRVLDVATRDQWTAQLAWVAWFGMTAAVIGALAARARLSAGGGAGTRMTAAIAAALGAAVVVPLTMQPARTAYVPAVEPVFVMGVCAGLGAVAGLFAAYAALSRAVARWSLATVGIAIWVTAIASVAPSFAPGRPLPAVRLGVFDAGFLDSSVTQRIALFTMPALALVTGVVLGWAARSRGLPTVTVALTGLAGPAMLTLAYLIAGPGSGADRYQVVPYWAAMTAAGAGVLGSVLTAVPRGAPPPTGRNQGAPSSSSRPGAGGGAPGFGPRGAGAPGFGPGSAGAPSFGPGSAGAPGFGPGKPGSTPDGPGTPGTPGFRPSPPNLPGTPGSRPTTPGTPASRPGTPGDPPAAGRSPLPQAGHQGVYRGASPNLYEGAPAPTSAGRSYPPAAPAPAQRDRGGKQQADGEFVDWVSGLNKG